MKKVVVIFAAVMTFVACSKSDDNANKNVDPIFSQEYFPLKNIQELEEGEYEYIGNKIADRPVGLVIPNNDTCKEKDKLIISKVNEHSVQEFIYFNNYYNKENKKCQLRFNEPRTINNIYFVKEGYITASVSPVTLNGEVVGYRGAIEIGYQAGYLRIEDYMSDYSRTIKNEKVYLYFKKK